MEVKFNNKTFKQIRIKLCLYNKQKSPIRMKIMDKVILKKHYKEIVYNYNKVIILSKNRQIKIRLQWMFRNKLNRL